MLFKFILLPFLLFVLASTPVFAQTEEETQIEESQIEESEESQVEESKEEETQIEESKEEETQVEKSQIEATTEEESKESETFEKVYSDPELATTETNESEDQPESESLLTEEEQPFIGTVDWSYQNMVSLNYNGGDGKTWSQIGWLLDPEGKYIYIGLKNVVPWIGERSTGNFSITTDLNNQYLFNIGGAANKVITGDGGKVLDDCVIVEHIRTDGAPDYDIEVRIPVLDLPAYKATANLGLYMESPVLLDLELPHEEIADSPAQGNIDGSYDEWEFMPRSQLDYTTNGGHDNKVDGLGSIYTKDGYIYGYCITEDTAHNQNAYDATYVTLYNRIPDYNNYPWSGGYDWQNNDLTFNYGQISDNGTIFQPNLYDMTDGTHKLYIFAMDGWGIGGQTLDNLQGNDLYGIAYVTIEKGKKVQSEWCIDAKKFAARYGMEGTDLHTVSAYYTRIGGSMTTSGTPTGWVWGIAAMLFLASLGVIWHSKNDKVAV